MGRPEGPTESSSISEDPDLRIRQQCSKVIQRAIAAGEEITAPDLGERIETAMYELHDGDTRSKSYRADVRTVAANIKRNQHLRRQICEGEVSPRHLVSMEAKELATEEQRRETESIEREQKRLRTIDDSEVLALISKKLQCTQCLGVICNYVDLNYLEEGAPQGPKRSDDGKPSAQAHSQRLVTCMTCGHRWYEDRRAQDEGT